jgi:hypothetical protein
MTRGGRRELRGWCTRAAMRLDFWCAWLALREPGWVRVGGVCARSGLAWTFVRYGAEYYTCTASPSFGFCSLAICFFFCCCFFVSNIKRSFWKLPILNLGWLAGGSSAPRRRISLHSPSCWCWCCFWPFLRCDGFGLVMRHELFNSECVYVLVHLPAGSRELWLRSPRWWGHSRDKTKKWVVFLFTTLSFLEKTCTA